MMVKLAIYQVVCWGDGTPLREFLHVDDLADAVLFVWKIMMVMKLLM